MKDLTAATVVADSVWDGSRLVTFHLTFPRFILAEFNTHRAFSRNSASSRAIPLKKQIKLVAENPFYPQEWPKNRSGMSASENLQGLDIDVSLDIWHGAINAVLDAATRLDTIGVHKQIANRLLEPFMWHTVICSTTMPGLDNFFAQRDHPDAQPEMQTLARKMREALEDSAPKTTMYHVPFHYLMEQPMGESVITESMLIESIARCGRISYGRELEDKTREENFERVLQFARDHHASPFEHCAVSKTKGTISGIRFNTTGNFDEPWCQVRHNIPVFLPSIAKELALT